MRRATATAIVMALVTGCATYKTSRRVAKDGLVLAGAGLLGAVATLVWWENNCDGHEHPSCAVPELGFLVSFFATTTGLPLAVAGGIGMSAFPKPDAITAQQRAGYAEQLRAVEASDAAARRARAWSITKQAAERARAGDCPTVREREREVESVDAEFHATVFLRDAAIARCLEASSSTAQPTEGR
jgi:hypothetical protein